MVEYTLFPGETADGVPRTVSSNGLEELLAYDDMFKGKGSTSTAVLTAIGYKPGMWQDVAADSWKRLYSIVDTMNGMGVNCALRTDATGDPETGRIWTSLMATRYPINDTPLDLPDDVERPSYDLEHLKHIFTPENESVDAVEREKGTYLGYPESGTEEYLRRRNSGHDLPDAIAEFGDRYGITENEQHRIEALHNYAIEDTSAAFEAMFTEVETRYRALEAVEVAYDVPVTETVGPQQSGDTMLHSVSND